MTISTRPSRVRSPSSFQGGRRETAPRRPQCAISSRQLPARPAVCSGIGSSSVLFASRTVKPMLRALTAMSPLQFQKHSGSDFPETNRGLPGLKGRDP